MREKHPRLVVAFHTTTAAMALEKYCNEHGIPGRLIPIPREITAGCGLAWMAERSWREEMEKLAVLNGVTYEAVYEN